RLTSFSCLGRLRLAIILTLMALALYCPFSFFFHISILFQLVTDSIAVQLPVNFHSISSACQFLVNHHFNCPSITGSIFLQSPLPVNWISIAVQPAFNLSFQLSFNPCRWVNSCFSCFSISLATLHSIQFPAFRPLTGQIRFATCQIVFLLLDKVSRPV
ncbi:MAG: hypothetical protein ACFFD4_29320, partial [Candidatus Odinarchaeota archaeon]